MHTPPLPSAHQPRLRIAAVTWLLAGCITLITTLIPAHTDLLGWTPAFWLLAAPLAVLLVLEPGWPTARRVRRRVRQPPWIHRAIAP